MTDITIYIILFWAIYQVYKHIFSPSKSNSCDKCAKKNY